jgi:hypothetical protein
VETEWNGMERKWKINGMENWNGMKWFGLNEMVEWTNVNVRTHWNRSVRASAMLYRVLPNHNV